MKYNDLLNQWKLRREQIRNDYEQRNEDGTRKYSLRSLAAKYEITDSRVLNIIHEYDKKPKS